MNQKVHAMDPLVERCQSGDRSAFRQLYDQYAKAMYNICLRLVNDVHDAEDMLQESFFQVFKSMDNFRGESTIGAWIKSIVVNKCLNHLKRKRLHFVQADNLEYQEEEQVNEDEFVYRVDSVRKAIQSLPDGYRVVLSLYLFEDFSHRQIAERLGISESTAKTQYMRAKQKVRGWVAVNGN